jgi:hypothetical protein
MRPIGNAPPPHPTPTPFCIVLTGLYVVCAPPSPPSLYPMQQEVSTDPLKILFINRHYDEGRAVLNAHKLAYQIMCVGLQGLTGLCQPLCLQASRRCGVSGVSGVWPNTLWDSLFECRAMAYRVRVWICLGSGLRESPPPHP